MVVWHLAGGNLSVVVGIEVVKDRLGMFCRGLVAVIGRRAGLGWSFGGCVVTGGTLRNRWLRHRFGRLFLLRANRGRQQQRASG